MQCDSTTYYIPHNRKKLPECSCCSDGKCCIGELPKDTLIEATIFLYIDDSTSFTLLEITKSPCSEDDFNTYHIIENDNSLVTNKCNLCEEIWTIEYDEFINNLNTIYCPTCLEIDITSKYVSFLKKIESIKQYQINEDIIKNEMYSWVLFSINITQIDDPTLIPTNYTNIGGRYG